VVIGPIDPGKEQAMSIFTALDGIVAGYTAARSRYLTARTLGSLPIELRKDIGWPDAMDARIEPRTARPVRMMEL